MNHRKVFLFLATALSLTLSSCVFHILLPSDKVDYDYTDEKGNTIYQYQKVNDEYKKENLTLENVGINCGYRYLPSLGNQKLLVVPVQFRDKEFTSTQLERLENVFFGKGEDTGWESVSSFYQKSSYGKLNLSGVVTKPMTVDQTVKTFSANYKKSSNNAKTYTDFVLDAVLQKLVSDGFNLTQYDTDKDGYVDAVWLVYSANYNRNDSSSPFWAYTTWEASPKVVDQKNYLKGCLYSWASIEFTVEKNYPDSFRFDSTSTTNGDAHTFIHETGHMLGLDDYYSYDYSSADKNYDIPLGGIDMMDMNIGDHCAYSKYLLGWISPLVISEEYLKANDYTLTLNSLADTSTMENKAFLLPSYSDGSYRYNGTPFDEYLLIEYSTDSDLNYQDSLSKYTNGIQGYSKSGVLVYHIDARVGRMLPDAKGTPIWDGTVYDGLPMYSTDWGRKLMYFYLYSNTRSYCYDTKISDDSSRFYRGRLNSLLPKSGNRTGDSIRGYSSNSSLYQKGDSFMVKSDGKEGTFSEFVFDDGTTPQFGFTVTNLSTGTRKQASLSFNRI